MRRHPSEQHSSLLPCLVLFGHQRNTLAVAFLVAGTSYWGFARNNLEVADHTDCIDHWVARSFDIPADLPTVPAVAIAVVDMDQHRSVVLA